MTHRPVPPHGSEGRYRGTNNRPACRCTTCTRGNRLAGIRRARTRQQAGSNLIDNNTLADHVKTLTDSGMSYSVIARHANVAHSTISAIINGRTRATQRTRGLRILAVHPGQFDADAIRPALGYIRRVRALYAAGHSHLNIAAAADLDSSTINALAAGDHTYVRPCVATGISSAYQALANTSGTNARSLTRAERNNWAGPDYWDPADFDDPEFEPATSDDIPSHVLSRHTAAEVQHLGSFGISEFEIGARLDRDPKYVRQMLAGDRGPGWRKQIQAA